MVDVVFNMVINFNLLKIFIGNRLFRGIDVLNRSVPVVEVDDAAEEGLGLWLIQNVSGGRCVNMEMK